MDNTSTLTLQIEGMHCDGCVRRVTGALKNLPGVRIDSVAVGSAALSYDPTLHTPEAIAAAVAKIGFTARPA